MIILHHIGRVLDYNSRISNHLGNARTLHKGFVAFAGDQFETPLIQAKVKLESYLHPTLSNPAYMDSIALTHEWMLLAISPVGCYRVGADAVKRLTKVADTTLSTTMRLYNLAKASFSIGMLSAIVSFSSKRAFELISKLRENPRLSQGLLSLSTKLGYVMKAGFFLNIFADIMTVQQAELLHKAFRRNIYDPNRLDEGVVKECYGMKIEDIRKIDMSEDNLRLITNHINFYKRIKMAQTATNIVKLASMTFLSYFPLTAPAVPALLLGSLIVKTGTDFWLQRRITQLKQELNVPADPKAVTIGEVASLVTLIATPFLLIGETAPFATAAIVGALAAEIFSDSASVAAA